MYNKLIIGIYFALVALGGFAQECTLTLSGTVVDEDSQLPMVYASIYVNELSTGVVTDSTGAFVFSGLCADSLHVKISHVGCETQDVFIPLTADTHLVITLDHHSHLLQEVAITAQHKQETTQSISQIGQVQIEENASKNLATMIEDMAGVSAIKNGNSIAKPIVHGMYGNRLTILNNGIPQNGQQWGADHAPEIDPQSANTISVFKGVSTLEYAGNSLGSVILLAPIPIANEPHIHGKASYFFESNGLGNGGNIQLQKHGKWLAWRGNATYKRRGDMHAPTYYLTNTGSEEMNASLQLEKQINKKLFAAVYGSTYNTRLGILRGAHIGNITDLEEAIGRPVPFYTNDYFSYDINAPYQRVNHNLLKAQLKYSLSDSIYLEGIYALQTDNRKEYDVRRSSTNTKPALSIEQISNYADVKYTQYFRGHWKLKSGYQYTRTDNTNIPETDILPLIPDYISYENGFFAMLSKKVGAWHLETGGRIDTEYRSVAAISNTAPREIIRYTNNYVNYGASVGLTYQWSDHIELSWNNGLAGRNPEVNELYSQGLHQGVGAIEEGNPDLVAEQSFKSLIGIKFNTHKKWFTDVVAYYQHIDNYIFLNPQDEIRLTIRGAFPVYKYEQADARIAGIDIASTYVFSDRWSSTLKYSFLQGDNLSENLPLINMPPNKLFGTVTFEIPKYAGFEAIKFSVIGQYVFEQKHYAAGQDYLAPPPAYFLLGTNFSAEKHVKKNELHFYLRTDNLLNNSYRDYLNRLRYFADETGLNVTAGVLWKF